MEIKRKLSRKGVRTISAFTFILICFGLFKLVEQLREDEALRVKQVRLENVQDGFNKSFYESFWPSSISVEDKTYSVDYTINNKLTKYIRKLLKRYRSDYSSVIVIDNNSGEVITALGYQREGNQFDSSMPFSSTHPSASLFKIVSAAELLEERKINRKTLFHFKGRGTTLYKYQLNGKRNKWSRAISFEKAFAYSNNVVFGKAAIKNLSNDGLYKMAVDFGFNRQIMSDLTVDKSRFIESESDYNRAEIASGFNKATLISPVHGAVMASIVANDGILKYPKVVSEIKDEVSGEMIWAPKVREERVLDNHTAIELKELMNTAVRKGTARRLHKTLPRRIRTALEIGGKTGSITGGKPFGKRDWFSVYALPKINGEDHGISICVMNVNVKKWYVKSTFLAKSIIEYYYKKVRPVSETYSSLNNKIKQSEKL